MASLAESVDSGECFIERSVAESAGRRLARSSVGTRKRLAQRASKRDQNRTASSDDRHGPVIITVIAVRMVQMSVNEVIDMVPMWDGLMSTTRAVNMVRIVSAALVSWRASIRVRLGHLDRVLDDRSVVFHVMQVAVVKIVDVVTVLNAGMFTVGTVLVVVVFVNVRHCRFSQETKYRSGIFHRVHDPIGHQSRNVSVCQTVVNVLSFAFGANNPFALEDPQPLRNGGQRFLECLGEFRDAA